MRKKLLALLLAAALALSLLAGCGGGESVASALLKLLDGRYPNISIEIDPELEADLRQAIRKAEAENAGDDDAVIRAALETALGSTITFRNLRNGQKGETAFDLVFYAGADPDKAAQAAYSQWNPILSNVPADGKYDTSLAMVETNSGVWMLVKATVEKAGTVDKPDKDDDEPEPPEPEKGYTEEKDSDGNVTYTIKAENGLQELFNDKNDSDFDGITITLEASVPYTVNTDDGPLAETFKGELQGNGATVTIKDGTQGLFNTNDGTVQDVDIQVTGTISNPGGTIGAVAGTNNGTIQNCDVTGGTIESTNKGDVGGIVGYNYGTIQGCSAAAAVKNGQNTGGIAGRNGDGGSITDCRSAGTVTSNNSNSYTGGVVGYNEDATITACYSTGVITGHGNKFSYTGGVAGANTLKSVSGGQIIACYHADGEVSGTTVGGVVGWNSSYSAVTACYWSGYNGNGIGSDSGNQYTNSSEYFNGRTNMVTDGWTGIAEAMNAALASNNYPAYWKDNVSSRPTLNWE